MTVLWAGPWLLTVHQLGLQCVSFLSLHRIQKPIFGVKCRPNYRVVKKEFDFLHQQSFFPFCFDFYSLMADCVLIVSVTFVRLVKASSYLGLTVPPLPCSRGWARGKLHPQKSRPCLGLRGPSPFSSPVGGLVDSLVDANPLGCKFQQSGSPCLRWSPTRGPRSAFKVS